MPDAIETAKLAVGASEGQGEPEAWTRFQLGKLYWSIGRVGASEQQNRAALRAFPGYHYALDALSRIQAAKGRYRSAIALEQQAVDRIPLPQYVAQLGDLYRVTGRPAEARKQYALVRVIERLLVANGVKTDLETALFDVDHGIRLRHALDLARKARADRPSIDGDDVLAWALARNGRCGEALPYSSRALRLGTRDALKIFHHGMIERCLRNGAAARRDFSPGARAQPALLDPLGSRRAKGTPMKTRLAVVLALAAALVVLVVPSGASAHPLGNFTVNHFAAVDLAGNTVYVRYALDLAEIPTFQKGAEVRRPGYAALLARELELRVDGVRVPLVALSTAHRSDRAPAG